MWIKHVADLLVLLHRIKQSLVACTLPGATLGRGTRIDGNRMFIEHGFRQLGQIATQHCIVHGTDVDAQHIALPIAATCTYGGQSGGGVACGDGTQVGCPSTAAG